jgi:hypothetical protein
MLTNKLEVIQPFQKLNTHANDTQAIMRFPNKPIECSQLCILLCYPQAVALNVHEAPHILETDKKIICNLHVKHQFDFYTKR